MFVTNNLTSIIKPPGKRGDYGKALNLSEKYVQLWMTFDWYDECILRYTSPPNGSDDRFCVAFISITTIMILLLKLYSTILKLSANYLQEFTEPHHLLILQTALLRLNNID